jgi:uncharacterized protein
MNALLTSFISGMVFALGLGISGMTRPVKVIGFLDFFGTWDASLAFVMIGAIAVYFAAYRWSSKMPSPLLASDFSLPKRSDLDAKLILGAAIFGAGWGLGGFCPGPALLIFVAAMLVGMRLHTWVSELGATTAAWGASPSKSMQDA